MPFHHLIPQPRSEFRTLYLMLAELRQFSKITTRHIDIINLWLCGFIFDNFYRTISSSVLPLKAARHDANANFKCFGALDTRDLISMVTFTFSMRRHLIRLASAHIFPPVWQRLVGFGFRVQRMGSTMQNLRRLGENSDPILSRLWTKVHEIFIRCRKSLVFSNALFQLSVSRFIQKIFAIKSRSRRKTEQMQTFFGLQFFVGGTTPTFLRQFVRATYYPLLGKVWLSSVCWSPSVKPGNEMLKFTICWVFDNFACTSGHIVDER